MFAIVQAIGWPIWPLIIASVVALALIIERGVALRRARIIPPSLLKDVLALHSRQKITPDVVVRLEANSPLGRVLAAGLRNVRAPRAIAGAAVANVGGHVAHELSRYLSLLGSIGENPSRGGGTLPGFARLRMRRRYSGPIKADQTDGQLTENQRAQMELACRPAYS